MVLQKEAGLVQQAADGELQEVMNELERVHGVFHTFQQQISEVRVRVFMRWARAHALVAAARPFSSGLSPDSRCTTGLPRRVLLCPASIAAAACHPQTLSLLQGR
jgi:hypothetical protein